MMAERTDVLEKVAGYAGFLFSKFITHTAW
jgi:hypothetical protein